MSRNATFALFLLLSLIQIGPLWAQQRKGEDDRGDSRGFATIETSAGSVDIELLGDQAPRAVENFVQLAGRNFFDGMRIHRVVKGVLIQTGDDKSKDPTKVAEWGTGGKSVWGKGFADEVNSSSALYKDGYKKGMVVMTNRGPNTNSSQFMILARDLPYWPRNYTVFGIVTRGQEVVDAISRAEIIPVIDDGDGRPKNEVTLKRVSARMRSSSKSKPVSDNN